MASLLLGAARVLCGEAATGLPLLERARPLLRSSEPSVLGAAGSLLAVAMLWVERFEESRRTQIDLVRRIRGDGTIAASPTPYRAWRSRSTSAATGMPESPSRRSRSSWPRRRGRRCWYACRTWRSDSWPVPAVALRRHALTWHRRPTSQPRSGSSRCVR